MDGEEPQVQDTLTELRRPFAPEAVKWKVQAAPRNGGKGLLVAYIDQRLVIERLNYVVGHDWYDAYELVPGGLECRLTVAGVTRRDVGWSQGTNTNTGLKGLYADALKRAAVKFGVGVSIYALPQVSVPAEALQQRGKSWVIPDQTLKRLRGGYRKWLEEVGAEAFGEPLAHGDVEDAQGDVEAEGAEQEVDRPPALTDERAVEQREEAHRLYDELRDQGLTKDFPPAMFGQYLRNAEHDHGELDAFLERLRGMRREEAAA